MPDPLVFVRNSSYELVGEITDYISLNPTPRYCDVGAWQLTLAAESAGTALLDRAANPGGGILVRRGGETLFSGPVRSHQWARGQDNGDGTITLSGPDDNCWFNQRLVYPDPTVNPDDMVTAYYRVASTDAETIMHTIVVQNLGPTAPIVPRRVSGLTMSTNLHRGAVQASPKYRFATVLEALQQMSVLSRVGDDPLTDLGFRIIQIGTGLQFQVYQSADRTGTARFSFDFGNLSAAEYSTVAPSTTYAILGAGNLDDDAGNRVAAQLFTYSRTDDYYPIRAETFVDVGTIDPTETDAQEQLDQQAQDAFESGAGQVGASISPIDTDRLKFGTDYRVGDFVSVELPFLTFQERVREVSLTYTASDGELIDVAVGTADGAYSRRTPGIYKVIGTVAKYLRRIKTIK